MEREGSSFFSIMTPGIKTKVVPMATAVFISILALIAAMFSAKSVIAESQATLVIKSRVDAGPWRTGCRCHPTALQSGSAGCLYVHRLTLYARVGIRVRRSQAVPGG
jgi:hypothetical protein